MRLHARASMHPCMRARVHAHACGYVQLRPSMTKFDSPHSALEVVGIARFNPGYLNRQIVLLLRTLGVREKVCTFHPPRPPPPPPFAVLHACMDT